MCNTQFLVFLTIILQYTSICKCSYRTEQASMSRILLGKRANLKDYSHVAQYFNSRSLCGANIITSRALITAAHCLDQNKDVSLMIFAIGNTENKVLQKSTITIPVWDYVIHSQYDDVQFHFDIAALFTDSPIPLSDIATRGLIIDTDSFLDEKRPLFIATGWGWTEFPNGSISQNGLQLVALTLVEKGKCMVATGMKFSDDVFCLAGDHGEDTCVGDSGSGIMWRGMIVGLVSSGAGCGDPKVPGLYANVFTLMEWIEDEIDKFHDRLCDALKKRD